MKPPHGTQSCKSESPPIVRHQRLRGLSAALAINPTAMPSAIQTLPHWLQLVLIVVPAVSAMFAAAGLFLNFYQSRRTNAQARATLVATCLKGFTDDEEIQRAFYAIEYGEFSYGDDFHKSEREREVDKLLRHFANLALSWKGGLLTAEDIRPVQYYILRVMRNTEIAKYMQFMDSWTAKARLGQHPYAVLGDLSEALSRL